MSSLFIQILVKIQQLQGSVNTGELNMSIQVIFTHLNAITFNTLSFATVHSWFVFNISLSVLNSVNCSWSTSTRLCKAATFSSLSLMLLSISFSDWTLSFLPGADVEVTTLRDLDVIFDFLNCCLPHSYFL